MKRNLLRLSRKFVSYRNITLKFLQLHTTIYTETVESLTYVRIQRSTCVVFFFFYKTGLIFHKFSARLQPQNVLKFHLFPGAVRKTKRLAPYMYYTAVSEVYYLHCPLNYEFQSSFNLKNFQFTITRLSLSLFLKFVQRVGEGFEHT